MFRQEKQTEPAARLAPRFFASGAVKPERVSTLCGTSKLVPFPNSVFQTSFSAACGNRALAENSALQTVNSFQRLSCHESTLSNRICLVMD
jgi:hypothetical protein